MEWAVGAGEPMTKRRAIYVPGNHGRISTFSGIAFTTYKLQPLELHIAAPAASTTPDPALQPASACLL